MKRFSSGAVAAAVIIALSTIVGGMVSSRSLQRLLPIAAARKNAVVVSDANGREPSGERVTSRDIEDAYSEAVRVVSDNYADEIDYEKANQAAIQGMLQTLDPHSNFFTRAEYEKLKQDQQSRFYGIGVSILRHRDGVYVQSTVENTPAERAGLRYGDRIVEVDGKDVREWTTAQVSKAVRGAYGQEVNVKVERAGERQPLNFTIRRGSVPQPSIRASYIIRPGVGYIALVGGFTRTTSDELRAALEDLKKDGMRQLVLDLRGNPGGLVDEAVKVSSRFLARGQTIVSVRGRELPQPIVYKNSDSDPETMPLVVLTNGGTASASEIVSGAIQDNGRGLIVGETSFGKGLVQGVFTLPYGTGLTLTTAHYYTPYGRLIQRDYSSGSLYDYYTHHTATDSEPQSSGANKNPSSGVNPNAGSRPRFAAPAAMPTPTPTPTPPPSGPAVKTAAGRIFYGGGGITPDIEVKPLDVTTTARLRIFEEAFLFTRQLAAGQVAGLENYRVEATQFGKFPRPNDYAITDKVVDAFRQFVKRDLEAKLTNAQIDSDLDYVKLRLRAEIVSAAYGGDAGTRVLLEGDPQLQRAIEALPEARCLAQSVYGENVIS